MGFNSGFKGLRLFATNELHDKMEDVMRWAVPIVV